MSLCYVQRLHPHRLARPLARRPRDSARRSSTTATSQTPRETSSPRPPPAALPPPHPTPPPLRALHCSATTISSVPPTPSPPLPASSVQPATSSLEARALGTTHNIPLIFLLKTPLDAQTNGFPFSLPFDRCCSGWKLITPTASYRYRVMVNALSLVRGLPALRDLTTGDVIDAAHTHLH